MLHGLCFREEAGARNLVFFRVKWLQPAMKGTSSVRQLWLRSVCLLFLPQCNGGLKLLWVCLCVRSYRVFWNLWLQIALEWLHDVARALFSGGSRSTKPCVCPWEELRCEVWRVQCDVWRKCLLDVALHRGRAQVMFLDNNITTASHKARTHRPGWCTAHASSFVVVLGSDSWKLRWHMRRDIPPTTKGFEMVYPGLSGKGV